MEARTEHPGARGLSETIGIDLGTTNCALAFAGARGAITVYDIPQLVAPGELATAPTLPSFLYRVDPDDSAAPALRLPWNASPDFVAGVLARDEGALVPARQISSAKSWLANPRVDRTAPLLPWGSESGGKLSPVDASARLLAHLRDAWNHDRGSRGEARLEDQQIVLTVPASFDEEARELTAAAARAAGFASFTLLEEPLAAVYAWISAHARTLTTALGDRRLILVVDVGGGTTDFSLVRADDADGELSFERIAIGEHLLLGGDNLDFALAVLAEGRMSGAKLSLVQRQILRRKCTAAKERLLSDPSLERVAITILGTGRGVIGGRLTTELTRDDVVRSLEEGFLPLVARDDLPAKDRRVGLRELGLPFESEAAITRHLAAFLTRAGDGTMVQPDAVLFNGGFFAPAAARRRIVDVLASWFGTPPAVLENARPDAAVAIGAAFYGRLRRDPGAARRLLIRAGSGRAYFIGVQGTPADAPFGSAVTALCVMPRGTQEGTTLDIDRRFSVVTNRPAAFSLHSSTTRTDDVNALVTLSTDDQVHSHAPLVTSLRFGKRSRSVSIDVRLSVTYTETGTLELWCAAVDTDHRWRLAFNLRAIETDPLDAAEDGEEQASGVVIAETNVAAAAAMIRGVFLEGRGTLTPATLVGALENALGHGKQSWPLGVLRGLCDVLLECEAGRRRSAAHEVRWLNLTGFCVRPGFGSASDPWRVSELRKVYAAGPAYPREVQNQVEWIVLWGRVGGGFSGGQQQELARRIGGPLGIGGRKGTRLNPQVERESWRLLAALERLDAGQRARLGDELLQKVRREPRNTSWLWAIGRLGARTPLYGPLNSVVAAAVAERWLDTLLAVKELSADAAHAIAQIGARTDDPARDVSEPSATAAAARLEGAGHDWAAVRLRQVVESDAAESGRVFGEALPEGLRLAAEGG